MLVAGLLTNKNIMTEEIKRLKQEIKKWKSKEVKERFERVNSQLHITTINELQHKIKRLKRGENI
jgi:tripartite-type tricarboxylate transporter receptor subunit TctC